MSLVTITGTAAGPCGCCPEEIPAPFKCRTRGGIASLCGYSEFASPSTPPRKYLTITLSGVINGQTWGDLTCSASGCDTVFTYSGECSYDAETCIETVSGVRTRSGSCGSPGPTPVCMVEFNAAVGDYLSYTRTTAETKNDSIGTCFIQSTTPPISNKRNGPLTAKAELSDEDTEENAIGRLLAEPTTTWSAWTQTGDGSLGTCIPSDCCLAQYEQRTTGFTFGYQEAQVRVEGTDLGLLPSTAYNVKVRIYRRVNGVNPYVLYATMLLPITTDGSGDFQVDADIPNDIGFDTYSASAVVVIPRS